MSETNKKHRHYKPKRKGEMTALEAKVAKQLSDMGLNIKYETRVLNYTPILKPGRYTVDFDFNKVIIEVKGWPLEAKDRAKYLAIKEQHPDIKIFFVFQNASYKINTGSKTTYGMWAEKHGFTYHDLKSGPIPTQWFQLIWNQNDPDNPCFSHLKGVFPDLVERDFLLKPSKEEK